MINQLLATKFKLGKGATSTVYRVENIISHKGFCCLKILKNAILGKDDDEPKAVEAKKRSIWDEEEENPEKKEEKADIKIDFNKVKSLFMEYEVLLKLDHPNIIKTYGFYLGDEAHNPAILLEYCKFTLDKVINDLEDFELVGVIYEICSAMKHVHQSKIIHRDLKMSNILVNLKKHVKICDFGIAKSIDVTTYTSMTHGVGTLSFMAPELFKEDSQYDEKVDVYSFGVVMYFIMTKGKIPTFNVNGYEKLKLPATINKLSQQIIKSCWFTAPDQRPSFDEILQLIIANNFMLIDGIEDKIPQLKKHLGI